MNPQSLSRKIAVKKPPVLFDKTQKIITAMERRLGGTFLAYWNSHNGSVCHNDVVALYELLGAIGPSRKVAMFIKSDGGVSTAALRIVNLLRQFTGRLEMVLPLECASAATMIALGADEIQMGPLAYLTAVDTSLTHSLSPVDRDNDRVSVSQDELLRAVKAWHKENRGAGSNPFAALYPHIHPLVIGAVDRATSLSTMLCEEILSFHMKDPKKARAISKTLNSSYPSHGYPITLKEALRIGLKVKPLDPGVNDLLLELNELYSEMGQQALTDYDEQNYHDNEIRNILEGPGVQIYYQSDKDWHYRKEERRWVQMNDNSSWRKTERHGKKTATSVFHIR
ncbi:MAG: ATP-dependent Clp protease proteolytic subunit [Verrucomicrobiota bacterium]